MLRLEGGSVINMASVASYVGFPRDAAYCASKGAVLMLTRQLALEYSWSGIRVNAICPGFIETPQLRYYIAEQEDPEAALAEVASLHPIGRVGKADEGQEVRNVGDRAGPEPSKPAKRGLGGPERHEDLEKVRRVGYAVTWEELEEASARQQPLSADRATRSSQRSRWARPLFAPHASDLMGCLSRSSPSRVI